MLQAHVRSAGGPEGHAVLGLGPRGLEGRPAQEAGTKVAQGAVAATEAGGAASPPAGRLALPAQADALITQKTCLWACRGLNRKLKTTKLSLLG